MKADRWDEMSVAQSAAYLDDLKVVRSAFYLVDLSVDGLVVLSVARKVERWVEKKVSPKVA